MPLQNKAMLANLTVRAWSARKRDKDVSKEVEKNHQANDAGNFNKLLIDAKALKPIVALTSTLRNTHYMMTLPWGDNGDRLLPAKMYLDYVSKMRGLRDQFNVAVNDFCNNYPTYRQEARKRLGTLYNPEDYPDASIIRLKFSAGLSFLPVPEAKDFRVDLDAEEVAEIRKDIEAQVAKQQEAAVRDLWSRLREAVQHIYERLSDPKAVFRDSLIENAQTLVSLAAKLNINDDEILDRACTDIEHRLCAVPPQRLRDDAALRDTVARSANDILKSLPKWEE